MEIGNEFFVSVHTLIKDKGFKDILFIENGEQDESYLMKGTHGILIHDESLKVTFIDRAHLRLDELMESLKTADVIIAETSFIESQKIGGIIKLLTVIEPISLILSIRGHSGELHQYLRSLNVYDTLPKLLGHTLYIADEDNDEITDIGLDSLIKKMLPKKSPLGLVKDKKWNVNVLRVTASGEEFDAVKLGDNVQLINKENPSTMNGAWVAGKTEPVLLVNFDGRHEWTYDTFDTLDKVLHYLVSMSSMAKTEDLAFYLGTFKTWVQRQERDTDRKVYDILNKVDELMGIFHIERRGNREQINSAFKEYLGKTTYFSEEPKGVYDTLEF